MDDHSVMPPVMPAPGTPACQELMRGTLEALRADLGDIKDSIGAVKDMLDAWDSVKGFGKTVIWLAKAIKVIAIIIGAFGVGWYIIKYGSLPPSSK